MRERDLQHKLAKKFGSEAHREKFKTIRNKVNTEIKNAEATYFNNKISECSQQKNVKKSWPLINSLL